MVLHISCCMDNLLACTVPQGEYQSDWASIDVHLMADVMFVTTACHGVQVYWLDIDIDDVIYLVLIYLFLPFIVPELCECLPISLILTGIDAGYDHIYYATDCYGHTHAIYIKLQSLIPVLRYTINRGDNDRS